MAMIMGGVTAISMLSSYMKRVTQKWKEYGAGNGIESFNAAKQRLVSMSPNLMWR